MTALPMTAWRDGIVRLRPVVPLLVLAAGVGLRIYAWWLDPSTWLDEQSLSLNLRERPLFGLIGSLDNRQSAPLGWLLSVSVATQIFGFSDRVLHLVPLLFSIATLVAIWWIGRRWLGDTGTTVALALAAVSPWLVRYSVEVKQYSADTFTVLVLLAMAGWVTGTATGASDGRLRRRLTRWWLVAGVGGLFSMAAIIVTPAIALVVGGWLILRLGWRRWASWRQALLDNLPGVVIWLAFFATHYLLSLRFAVESDFLASYWEEAGGFPVRGDGLAGIGDWIWSLRLNLIDAPLIDHRATGGAVYAFWFLALVGWICALRYRPVLGALLVSLPLTGVLLAVLHVAPLTGRLALWLAPVCYLAVGAAGTALVSGLAARTRSWRWSLRWPALAAGATLLIVLMSEVMTPAIASTQRRFTRPSDRQDRQAIQYLLDHREPGDVVLIMDVGERAWSWYVNDGESAYVAVPSRPGPACDPDQLITTFAGTRRLFVLTGYIRNAVRQQSPRADQVTVAQLATAGRILHIEQVSRVNVVYLLDMTAPPTTPAFEPPATGLSCTRVVRMDTAEKAS